LQDRQAQARANNNTEEKISTNRRSRRVYLAILLSMGMTFINNSIYKKESY
jgi:hypothetical protein